MALSDLTNRKRITCDEREAICAAHDLRPHSSLTNYVGGEVLNHALPAHSTITWMDADEVPVLIDTLDAEHGCRHWKGDRCD